MFQTDLVLLRGASGKPDMFQAAPRTDRRPLSTGSGGLNTFLYNQMFEHAFGEENIRSRTLYTTPSIAEAEHFAGISATLENPSNIYLIFPDDTSRYIIDVNGDSIQTIKQLVQVFLSKYKRSVMSTNINAMQAKELTSGLNRVMDPQQHRAYTSIDDVIKQYVDLTGNPVQPFADILRQSIQSMIENGTGQSQTKFESFPPSIHVVGETAEVGVLTSRYYAVSLEAATKLTYTELTPGTSVYPTSNVTPHEIFELSRTLKNLIRTAL